MRIVGSLRALGVATTLVLANLSVTAAAISLRLWGRSGFLAAASLLFVLSFSLLLMRPQRPWWVLGGAVLATLLIESSAAALFGAVMSHPAEPIPFSVLAGEALGSFDARDNFALALPAFGLILVSALGGVIALLVPPSVRRPRHAA